MSILVVENSRAVCQVTCTMLETTGIPVHWTNTAATAKVMALQYRPAVILFNYELCDSSCTALISWLRRCLPLTRIIVTSAATTDAKFDEAINKGADSFLPKPYHLSDLCECVWRVINIQRTDTPLEKGAEILST